MTSSPPIQWYPGHIAKAERQLKEQLKKVDIVLEVRDLRIPMASHHPQVAEWLGAKPKILVLNRQDMVEDDISEKWLKWFKNQGETPYLTNAQQGKGIKAIKFAAQQVGTKINQRRKERGMLPRPVRAGVIGFPNVGKSALINRLVGRKVVASARKAGVTRQLRWVKISKEIELLDAPGVIPWRLENQIDAIKLAICDDIGDAAYDNQRVAASLVDFLAELKLKSLLQNRYDLAATAMTGEDYIQQLSVARYQNDKERAARQILNDFRTGLIGKIALEVPK
ncbi:MAG: ribosome biogenesis GTPase YlqF [Cyanobacteria bacterium J083]|nr:MAG: ribosome biogenesis GTPase YlqF [Cyanobacteria bacterium J083]